MPTAKVSGPNAAARIDRSALDDALTARLSSDSWACRILQARVRRAESEVAALEASAAEVHGLDARLAGVIAEARRRLVSTRRGARRCAEIVEGASATPVELLDVAEREAASLRSAAAVLRAVGVPVVGADAACDVDASEAEALASLAG